MGDKEECWQFTNTDNTYRLLPAIHLAVAFWHQVGRRLLQDECVGQQSEHP
jgi:hypothetical protein